MPSLGTYAGLCDLRSTQCESLYCPRTRWCPEAGPVKNPGTRRRTAARTVQDRAGAEIRAVGLTVVNGKWLCDYTDQGVAARQRAQDQGYRGSRPTQPRDQSLHRSNIRSYFQPSSVDTDQVKVPFFNPLRRRGGAVDQRHRL